MIVRADVIDEYLREFRDMTLDQFIAKYDALLPRPHGLQKTEVVLTEMWERAVKRMPRIEKEVVFQVMMKGIPFTGAAQMVALANGDPGRLLAMGRMFGVSLSQ
jgi:hypothetical protein